MKNKIKKITIDDIQDAGYNNYWKVLNAKDYGIPQNRGRVFIVSIRKDVDTALDSVAIKDMVIEDMDEPTDG